MGSEPVGLDIGESNAFITKLIVEMKNTFNSDKKDSPGEEDNDSDSASPDDSEVVKNDIDIEGLNDNRIDVTSPSVIPENIAAEVEILGENNVVEEVNQIEEIKDTVLSPEESRESNESEEKPRIVMHFRKPKNDTNITKNKRIFRNKVQETQLKRSARRRKSKDGESVLQSAIARKEKSYNEGIKPQRLTRQLKLTPKILENLNQNQLKETMKSKSTRMAEKQSDNNDKCVNMSEGIAQSVSENCRKHKLKCASGEKQSKRTNKRLKSSQSDSDIDQCEKIVKENSYCSGDQCKSDIKIGIEERRRSQRRSTR